MNIYYGLFVYSDIIKDDQVYHSITGVSIRDF